MGAGLAGVGAGLAGVGTNLDGVGPAGRTGSATGLELPRAGNEVNDSSICTA